MTNSVTAQDTRLTTLQGVLNNIQMSAQQGLTSCRFYVSSCDTGTTELSPTEKYVITSVLALGYSVNWKFQDNQRFVLIIW